ncbi:hypothetical protein TRFO_10987 [Tritrichomonas foetus]|uniref:PDEase domain-containing protein n=1 Tax=Tritrichomonas foetus TaxID=1144522 RepID=A0A1J4J5V7_9EUKA|nr:hypothetical protein TRFO_10987 [Tritrichomonas foetus]|eukprot:OHS94614.1 hypothetical protein TRFO_10987 [Tritrichomonas foetus]
MKKLGAPPKRPQTAIIRDKLPSPQDPFPNKSSLKLAIPHVQITTSTMNLNQEQTPSPHARQKQQPGNITINRNLPLNQSSPLFLQNNSSPKISPQTPFSRSLRKYQRPPKPEVNFDDFFCSLSTHNYITSIEMFVSSNLNAKTVIYWEEVPSIQQLISEELKITVNHTDSLIGFAFRARKKLVVPVAQEHHAYNPTIDMQVLNPLSMAIFIPLIDYKNQVIALLEVVKRHNDNYVKDSDHNFIDVFQKKFQAFSHWIIESRNVDDITFNLMRYDETTQFVLNFQHKMNDLFDCILAEIWLSTNENTLKLYRGGDIIDVPIETCGIVSDILKKSQILNCPNVRLQSSFSEEVDEFNGSEGPLLGIPVITLNYTIIVVLRGRDKNSIFSATNEKMLSRLAPFIATGFINTLHQNNEENDVTQLLISALPTSAQHEHAKAMLNDTMDMIMRLTDSARVTFYIIDKDKLVSIYHTGLKQSITLPIGKGHAGQAALKGIVINVADAYSDPHFDSSIDDSTGFKTISMLTVPIFSSNGSIISVVQAMNKKNGIPFSTADTNICRLFGTFCSMTIDNTKLLNQIKDQAKRTDVIFKSLHSILEQPKENIIQMILESLSNLLHTPQCDAYLFDEAGNCFFGSKDTIDGRNGSAHYCFEKNESFFVNNPERDARTIGEKFTNICIVPMVSRPTGEKIGFLRVINKPQKFDENDLNTMQIFSSILSLLICESKLLQYFEAGANQLAADRIITRVEIGTYKIPTNLKLDKITLSSINCIEFDMFQQSNLFKIVYYAFDYFDLMKTFSITNDQLLKFLFTVKKKYKNKPFHGFTHSIDMLQYFLYLIKTAHMLDFLRSEELLVFSIACIGAYIDTDEKNNSYHKQTFSPLSLLYKEKPTQTNKCTKMHHILQKESCNLFKDVENQRDAWELFFSLLMVTDHDEINDTINKLRYIVSESTVDLNNQSHRRLLLTVLFESCQFGYITRPFEICKEWFNREKEEMFILGDLESANHFQYSSEYNSREHADDFAYETNMITNLGIPLLKVTASFLGDLSILEKAANSNLKAFEEASMKRKVKISVS